MAVSILSACGIQERLLPSMIFIREESGVDGSFLISSVLTQRLNVPDSGVVLGCFHHTFEHYVNAGMRLLCNLNTFQSQDRLRVVDFQHELFSQLLESPLLADDELTIVNHFWKILEDELSRYVLSKAYVTLIIDDLATLANLGVSENTLITLCKRIRAFANASGKVTAFIKTNNSDVFEHLCNNLEDLTDLEIQIVRLKSGNFREVDGKVITVRRERSERVTKTVLYKVNDRNIKTYLPGTVGAKG